MEIERNYLIGDCLFRVAGQQLNTAVAALEGFGVFVAGRTGQPLFGIAHQSHRVDSEPMHELYRCSTDYAELLFGTWQEGYALEQTGRDDSRLLLRQRVGEPVLWLQGDLFPILLRFALWVAYGLAALEQGRMALHGSCICKDGKAFLFLGESGTGKSTHTRLWRENIAGSVLLNDDSPIVAVEEDGVYVYGSPWSGKTPCYRCERYPLGGVVRLVQAPYNRMDRLNPIQAYAAVHPSCPPMFAYDARLYDEVSRLLGGLIARVPFFRLACRPDREAALLSCHTLLEAAL